ncbi:hypothetical protein [Lysobacter gummosus]
MRSSQPRPRRRHQRAIVLSGKRPGGPPPRPASQHAQAASGLRRSL